MPTLARSTARAAVWALMATIGVRVIAMLSLVVLTRLLSPRDFGLLAFALVYITFVETLGDLGSGMALIYWPDRRDEAANVSFFTSQIAGAAWFVATLAAAPFIADFFNAPEGAPILRALAFYFPIRYLGTTHDALAQKSLQFRSRTMAELGMGAVKAGVSITGAFAGLGAWSLVWGQLSGVAVWTILLWLLVDWRPSRRLSRDLFRPMLSYGRGIVIVNIVAAVTHHADTAVVGRMLGPAALGIYQIAYKVPEMSIAVLMWVVSRVAFPAFSHVRSEKGDLAVPYLASLRYVTAMTIPAAVGLVLVAEPLVLTLFGAKWSAAVPVLRWIALFMAIRSFGTSAGDVMKATGRSHLLATLGVIRAVVLVPALIVAGRYGISEVAITVTAVALLGTAANVTIVNRLLKVGIRDMFVATRSALLAGVVLTIAGYATGRLLSSAAAIELVLVTLTGAVTYLGALYLIDAAAIRQIVTLLRREPVELR
jgi:O-antigen/teichoic acid export membrane protein